MSSTNQTKFWGPNKHCSASVLQLKNRFNFLWPKGAGQGLGGWTISWEAVYVCCLCLTNSALFDLCVGNPVTNLLHPRQLWQFLWPLGDVPRPRLLTLFDLRPLCVIGAPNNWGLPPGTFKTSDDQIFSLSTNLEFYTFTKLLALPSSVGTNPSGFPIR